MLVQITVKIDGGEVEMVERELPGSAAAAMEEALREVGPRSGRMVSSAADGTGPLAKRVCQLATFPPVGGTDSGSAWTGGAGRARMFSGDRAGCGDSRRTVEASRSRSLSRPDLRSAAGKTLTARLSMALVDRSDRRDKRSRGSLRKKVRTAREAPADPNCNRRPATTGASARTRFDTKRVSGAARHLRYITTGLPSARRTGTAWPACIIGWVAISRKIDPTVGKTFR